MQLLVEQDDETIQSRVKEFEQLCRFERAENVQVDRIWMSRSRFELIDLVCREVCGSERRRFADCCIGERLGCRLVKTDGGRIW